MRYKLVSDRYFMKRFWHFQALNRVGIRNSTDYSPFGVGLDGRTVSVDGYRFGFNAQEKDDEIKGEENSYDFGNRMYDQRIARFIRMDTYSGKFAYQSPYTFAGNNPVAAIDLNGDSIWVTTTSYYKNVGGQRTQYITNTIHVTGKILDLSGVQVGGGGCSSPKNGMYLLEAAFEKEINGLSASQVSNGVVVEYKFDVQFDVVSSMKDVKESDHIIVIVDEVTGTSDKNLGGGDAGGLALLTGKIAYVENTGNFSWMASTMIHEFGHNMGLPHVANGSGNYMSYDKSRTHFDFEQFQTIHGSIDDINKARNWSIQYETEDNTFWHTSSNLEPYDMDVKKGEKTPRRINN